MKCKSIVAAVIAISAFSSIEARAENTCFLSISPFINVPIHAAFSFTLDIAADPPSLPLPSPLPPPPTFTVVFFGTKNGVSDIPPSGETYPGYFPVGHSELTGYSNPGGVTGLYLRYAILYYNDPDHHPTTTPFCVTNGVFAALE